MDVNGFVIEFRIIISMIILYLIYYGICKPNTQKYLKYLKIVLLGI